MLRVQQIQQDHNERLLRLERRQDDDSRIKSVWGSTASFPSVLSGTPHQTPLHHLQSDTFNGFDDEQNMIGSLHLDAETEPRRGATSRANSVRFDESANQGHWAQNSRTSIDIIPRTGSSIGGLPLTERTSSYKSEGRQSSGGQSVHSATSGRANSLGLDTGLGLGQSAASYPGTPNLAPGLFVLGSVPSIVRCWLDMNFKHDSLLYAAVCTGSYKSLLDFCLVERLGFTGLLKQDNTGHRVIRLPMYLPEAITHPPSSRSSSPAPQLPTITVDFTVFDSKPAEAGSKAIQIFIGSDTLRIHNADVLFSSNQVILFDDDHTKVTVPLVRPENDATFKSLFITSGDPSQVRTPDVSQFPASSADEDPVLPPSFVTSPTPMSLVQDASSEEKAKESASATSRTGSPLYKGPDATAEEDMPTPSAAPSTSAQRPSLEILTGKGEQKASESTGALGPTPPRSGSAASGGIWTNWRREGSVTNQMDWANASKSPNLGYQRRDTGIKVLKPTKPTSRTLSSSTAASTATSVTSPGAGQSRFFDEGRKRGNATGSESNGSQLRRMGSSDGRSEGVSKENPIPPTSKPRSANPVGGASAFSWLNSEHSK
ncbi:MAG: CSN-associated deubiquitinating enzyme Ubp12 [Bathelium mastoideum]|nr:MAG: CSN-associated deubiquitinating enzyme Ubp12 [Bathelium mastoideum]